MSLFDAEPQPVDPRTVPLAERMRPRTLDEVVGQDEVIGPGRPLREMIERDLLQSIILWGPPGTGKTTLARLVADLSRANFVSFSAVLAGIKEVKEVMAAAEERRRRLGTRTIVFVDEIHRFNKAQQDAFLPRVEAGDIVLIGATTENPSFEVNAALLSRSKVFVLKPLDETATVTILRRALEDEERGLGREHAEADRRGAAARGPLRQRRRPLGAEPAAAARRIGAAAGRPPAARRGAARPYPAAQGAALRQGRRGALQPDLGAPQVDAQQRPRRRRLLARAHGRGRRGSESTSRAGWCALRPRTSATPTRRPWSIAMAARDAAHFLGFPEANTALAQSALYLATAPKSNAVYAAYNQAAESATRDVAEPVPLHLRNAPTRLMKQLDYGKGYQYAHDQAEGVADMDCLPERLRGRRFYQPTERGFEKEIKRRLDGWQELKKRRRETELTSRPA